MNNIKEVLQLQNLSEEEKASRHILGRLYGPIATTTEGTRNGRKYNRQLWEKALNDEIFKEKVANKALFLELGHPADRTETDMTKVCACIPEMPKIINGDLYAYIDIVDLPNGKILKTLCDYGFIPGISSRGSGDVDYNNEVDPETFFLETWDIVGIPAVKKARLSMCEGLDEKNLKLKKALTESYEAATDKDKETMKEALDNLNIKLDEEKQFINGCEVWNGAEEEWLAQTTESLNEEAEEETAEVEETTETEEEIEEKEENITTIKDFKAKLNDLNDEDIVEFTPIIVGEKEMSVNDISFTEDEGKVLINIDYDPILDDNIDAVDEKSEEDEAIDTSSEEVETEENVEDDASDAGMDEALNQLKEMIHENEKLKVEVKSLQEAKTVSDAEVESLKEDLNKYKTSFERVSELAAESKELKVNNQALQEQLEQKDTEIRDLQTKAANTVKLNESIDENAHKVQVLTEELSKVEQKLNEQKAQYSQKLTESTAVAKSYKAKFTAVLNKYVESKASMLGVRSTDITSRLNENFSFDDIDKVCDDLLEESIGFSRYNIGGLDRSSKVKFNESMQNTGKDDDLNDLYELAGLKR